MQYHIPRHEMFMGEPVQRGQNWTVFVSVPIKDIDNIGDSLHSNYSMWQVGDLIHVCSFENRSWRHLEGGASYRIISLDDDTVKVVQIGDEWSVEKPKKAKTIAPGEPLEVQSVNGVFEVRDGKGNTIEMFVERRQAEAFARREGTRKAA
jgi:hypothetical protein